MANEYIRRQDAVDALAKTMPTPATPDGAGEFDHEIHIADEAFADAIRIIESLEPADVVEVKHGEWISECEPYYECSECHHWFYLYQYMNYCPNCGAKMDGERKE